MIDDQDLLNLFFTFAKLGILPNNIYLFSKTIITRDDWDNTLREYCKTYFGY